MANKSIPEQNLKYGYEDNDTIHFKTQNEELTRGVRFRDMQLILNHILEKKTTDS